MQKKKRSPLPLLAVHNLRVSAGKSLIVRGLSFQVNRGEVHAIMGPNGSGKSTLVGALMGHPGSMMQSGKVSFMGKNLLSLSADERACAGLFLAFQYPREIAGLSLRSLLFAAYEAQQKTRDPHHRRMSPIRFRSLLEEAMSSLHMDPAFAERAVNQGFSGGEKKKSEILQMQILRPVLALLDETDSGLDIDALRTVANGIERMRGPKFSAVVITHYARLLRFLVPDRVHVMIRGKIVESGGPALAEKLEREGYRRYGVREIALSG
ncbi:MAG: Fe-S cluster assembly ATPase SufC [Candidatus Peribacteraceae bacterium]